MRNFIIYFFMLFSSFSYSQENLDINSFRINSSNTIDSSGKSYIVLTLEEANILNDKLDMLDLYIKSNEVSNKMDSVFNILINQKNVLIYNQSNKITFLENSNTNLENKVENLQKQIELYQLNETNYIKELDNKNSEIDLNLSVIKKLKRKRLFSNIYTGVILGGVVTAILIN